MSSSTRHSLSLMTPAARVIIENKVATTGKPKRSAPRAQTVPLTAQQEHNTRLFHLHQPAALRAAEERDPRYSLFELARPVLDKSGSIVAVEVDYSTKPNGDLKSYTYQITSL